MHQKFENWTASVPHGIGAHFYSECSSTNILAAEYARAGKQSPVWIVAGEQTGGKGRKGRTWVSNKGNLYASLLFSPAIKPGDLNALPFLIALAVRDTLIELGASPADVQCKWPNDILVKGRKICGILIESSARSASALDYVIVGIGINLLNSPVDAQFKATSLMQSLEEEVPVQTALACLAVRVKDRLDAWNTDDFEPTRNDWTACAWGLGEIRCVSTATEAFEAKLVGLDGQGGLLVQLADGTSRQIVVADIFPVGTQNNKDTH